jgi:hypothetical protein
MAAVAAPGALSGWPGAAAVPSAASARARPKNRAALMTLSFIRIVVGALAQRIRAGQAARSDRMTIDLVTVRGMRSLGRSGARAAAGFLSRWRAAVAC